jgi:hypothetical protein
MSFGEPQAPSPHSATSRILRWKFSYGTTCAEGDSQPEAVGARS